MRNVLLTLALLACAAASAAPVYDGSSVILNDFESPGDLAHWQVRELTRWEWTSAWAAHGRGAAAITYEQWSEGKQQWPAVLAVQSLGSLAVTDFGLFETLDFSLYNPQDEPADIAVHARDLSQARFSLALSVPGRSRRDVSIAIDEFRAQKLDVSQVTELHFYTARPSRTYTVYLDHLRLGLDLRPRADVLARGAEALLQQVASVNRRGLVLPADLERALAQVPVLEARSRRLQERVSKAQPGELEEALRTRRELLRLAKELEGLRPVGMRLKAFAFARERAADRFVLGLESPMQKVFLPAHRFTSSFSPRCDLFAARNEHESTQVIVYPLAGELRHVKWALSPLTNAAGQSIPATVRVVGYVDCQKPSYGTPGQGWYPDPLLDFMADVERVASDEVQPLWVTISVPATARPGEYAGKLTVTADGARAQSVDLRLHVWDFALPEHSSLRTALQLSTALGGIYPKEQMPEMVRKYEDWMLREYHLNPGSIYAQVPVWDATRLRELKALGLSGINLSYVNAPTGKDFSAEKHWQRLEQQMAAIESYLKVVDEAGVRDLCYIYCFDERPGGELDMLFETAAKLRQRFPDIEVMTTAYDSSFGMGRPEGDKVNIWVPLTPKFDQNAVKVAQAKQAGRDVWWYICIGPQHPYANWFIEYPAIEARVLMGAMTAHYQPGGFLYYAVNRWPVNRTPITSGPRTDWNPASYLNNNGDGSVMCAGPDGPLATLRLENIRDGMEDYECYLLLRKLLADRQLPSGAGEVPQAVVQDLTHFTSDPQVLAAERQRVSKEIMRLLGK